MTTTKWKGIVARAPRSASGTGSVPRIHFQVDMHRLIICLCEDEPLNMMQRYILKKAGKLSFASRVPLQRSKIRNMPGSLILSCCNCLVLSRSLELICTSQALTPWKSSLPQSRRREVRNDLEHSLEAQHPPSTPC